MLGNTYTGSKDGRLMPLKAEIGKNSACRLHVCERTIFM
jgi:hypothetical protein